MAFARPGPNLARPTAVMDARKRAAEAASRVLGQDATSDFVYQARREQQQAEEYAATQRAFEHQYMQQQMAQAQAVRHRERGRGGWIDCQEIELDGCPSLILTLYIGVCPRARGRRLRGRLCQLADGNA